MLPEIQRNFIAHIAAETIGIQFKGIVTHIIQQVLADGRIGKIQFGETVFRQPFCDAGMIFQEGGSRMTIDKIRQHLHPQ